MAVPFFSENSNQKWILFKNSLNKTTYKKTVGSLQVPDDFPLVKFLPEKRVLPFTLPELSKREEASLTLEAALGLSIFILAVSALLQPIRWLDRQRKIQMEMERFCEDLSQYAYGFRLGERGEEPPAEDEEGASYQGFFSGGAAGLWLRYKINGSVGNVKNMNLLRADALDTNDEICFEVEYQEPIPYFRLARGAVSMRTAARRRAWTGIDGKLKKEGNGKNGGEENDDKIVYVGKNMGRYHWFRDCHYISNQYQSVSASKAKEMRNESGRRYQACASCAAKGDLGGSVYLTPEGEHYHSDKNCRAMLAYVRAVSLKEVESLGACSYCNRRKGEGI